ncbi:MAG TPA: DUF2911 domain-containing protein [Agriterribacter sp.]|nr:DUF2911 domain-containing protein [Agriterribacter sp.]
MTYPTWQVSRILILLACVAVCGCRTNSSPAPAPIDTTKVPVVPLPENGNPYAALDKSPLDILYFPPDYPKLKMIGKASPLPMFRVIYSRPQKHGRPIFGSVVKYGEHWRLGANEATEIEFFEPVIIQKKEVPRGRYILYCIPQPEQWTLVLNSELYSWGLVVDTTKDVFKFTVPVVKMANAIEAFTMEVEKDKDNNARLWIGWDKSKVVLPIKTLD